MTLPPTFRATWRRPEFSNLGLGLVTLALTFPASVLVARALGPEGRGTYALVVMLSALLSLVGAGGLADVAPQIAGQGRGGALAAIESLLARRAGLISLLWGAGLGAALLTRDGTAGWTAGAPAGALATVALAAAAAAVTFLGALWPFYLQVGAAQGKVRLPARAEALRIGVYIVGVLLLIGTKTLSVAAAIAAFALSYFAGEAIVRRRLAPNGWVDSAGTDARTADSSVAPHVVGHEQRQKARAAMIGRLLEYGASRLDVLLVGAWLGARSAGLYAVAVGVVEPLLLAANAAAPAVLAHVVRPSAVGSRRFVAIRLAGALGVAAAGATVLAILGPLFIRLLFGAEFSEAVAPMRLLAFAYVMGCGVRLLRTANIGFGRMRANWLADLVAVALLVLGAALVVRDHGLIAAAAVSALATTGAMLVLAWGLFVTRGAPLSTAPADA